MSEEQLKAFLEKVKGDSNLQEKLKAASDADGVLAIAKEAGFKISAEDLNNTKVELSEEEMERVAGGDCQGSSSLLVQSTKCVSSVRDYSHLVCPANCFP
jgi:predicted ribosomally synthesized peptide with nif11-like leader